MALLENRRGLVVGIANQRSIAYGIAKSAHANGAELALTYQGDKLEGRVRGIAAELGDAWCAPLDVTDTERLSEVADELRERWGRLDFLVHAVAYAERADLEGRFVETSREGFRTALDVSVYSLVSLARAFEPLLAEARGSILTLSYYGAQKAVPNYNVMGVAKAALEASVRYLAADLGPSGIRVNAISAGPIKTLSAAGISGLRSMLSHVEAGAPMRRNVTIEDVGRAAMMPLSDLSSGMTGEVLHVDAGYHALGAVGVEG
ncbi:MAG: enoyl-ACP reductase [Myxococcota bacterium]